MQVVVSVEHFVVFCGHFVFLMLTRPSAHNKNFPYHVRTTQIGIMEAMTTNTSLGPNTLDRFANGGSYGVSAPATGMDVFTVDTASRVPPPPYQASNGLPSWSITSQAPNGVHSNGNSQPKIYDPNDDDDIGDWNIPFRIMIKCVCIGICFIERLRDWWGFDIIYS